jgi:hypothetical protein
MDSSLGRTMVRKILWVMAVTDSSSGTSAVTPRMKFQAALVRKMSKEGADSIDEASQSAGVLVTARRTFDIAHAWGGKHPMNVPIVVVTHRVPQKWVNKPGSPFTFVTDGVESAI